MQAIVLAKTLHFLSEEGAFQLKGKTVLDLGCGVGFVGIYLGCLGCQVVLADFPSLKDLVERNIGINKSLFKGKVDFTVANWYLSGYAGKMGAVLANARKSMKYTQQRHPKNSSACYT